MTPPSRLCSIRGHHILGGCLPRGAVVLDAGAHRGEFSRQAKAEFGCRCFGLEPNPSLFSALLDDDFECKRPSALSGQDGTAKFVLSENPEAGHLCDKNQVAKLDSVTVDAITLETAMNMFGLNRIDLLKLDVEGAEFQVLGQTPARVLEKIGQITVEFHDFLPEWRQGGKVAAARSRLESLGFICCPFSLRTNGDILFVNTAWHKLGFLRKVYLRRVARYVEKAAKLFKSKKRYG